MTSKQTYGLPLALAAVVALAAGCASTTEIKEGLPKAVAADAATDNASILPSGAALQAVAPFEGKGWKSLFDGKSLKGWAISDFSGHPPIECESGLIVVPMGDPLAGINWTNDLPRMNYEVALDAMRIQGSDFFCALTFPVADTWCTLVLGGWGGSVTGISSLDGEDASENETTQFLKYEKNKWYRVRVRVTEKKIEAWVDSQKMVDLKTEGHKITMRYGEIEASKPLGLATYQTTAAYREIKLRRLDDATASKN